MNLQPSTLLQPFKLTDLLLPLIRYEDGLHALVIERDQNDFPARHHLVIRVHHTLLHGYGLVADSDNLRAGFDIVAVMRGGSVLDMDVRNDDADLHKGLVFAKQPHLHKVVDARLLEIGQVLGVVDVSLRVQIPVADFGGMEEFVIGHGAIIV